MDIDEEENIYMFPNIQPPNTHKYNEKNLQPITIKISIK